MAKFSIIVPVYNVAPWLQECLDSVLAQTFTDWECLCVNDGSTDDAGAILDDYAAQDPRFRVFHKQNGGVSSARNLALNHTKGDWILFLDGDDLIHPQMLETLVRVLSDTTHSTLIKFNYSATEHPTPWTELTDADKIPHRLDISEDIPFEEFHSYCCQYCYARSLLNGLLFPDYTYGEDRVFIAQVLLNRANAISHLSAPLYVYRQRPNSVVHTPPSSRGIRDELHHRRDIVLFIESASKQVPCAGTPWLEDYFAVTFFDHLRRLPRKEHPALWRELKQTLHAIHGCASLSIRERLFYTTIAFAPLPLTQHLLRAIRLATKYRKRR